MYLHSKTEYTGTAKHPPPWNQVWIQAERPPHAIFLFVDLLGRGGGKGCLNFPFIVSKIVAYKCLINQIYNFMPEMLFVLQEYVTCHTCK